MPIQPPRMSDFSDIRNDGYATYVTYNNYEIIDGCWEFSISWKYGKLSITFDVEGADIRLDADFSYYVRSDLGCSCFMGDLIEAAERMHHCWIPQLRCRMPECDKSILGEAMMVAWQYFRAFHPEECLDENGTDVYHYHISNRWA